MGTIGALLGPAVFRGGPDEPDGPGAVVGTGAIFGTGMVRGVAVTTGAEHGELDSVMLSSVAV
jgi:hypothetical protein